MLVPKRPHGSHSCSPPRHTDMSVIGTFSKHSHRWPYPSVSIWLVHPCPADRQKELRNGKHGRVNVFVHALIESKRRSWHIVVFQRFSLCLMSSGTSRFISDGKPKTATSTFTQLLSSEKEREVVLCLVSDLDFIQSCFCVHAALALLLTISVRHAAPVSVFKSLKTSTQWS